MVKNPPANAGDIRDVGSPWVRKMPWRRKWQPAPVFFSGEFHGQRSLYLGWQRVSNQCKEIEENNRMGKTRNLFRKNRDTKGTFHAKMDSIKDRNGMDLTEADIKKRWQEYTEEL